MNFSKTPFIIFLSVIAISLYLSFYYYSNLPDRAAIHFNIYGEVESYSEKEVLLIINLIVVSLIGALFYLVGKYIHKIPANLLNLPNKDFWLKLEHKEFALNKTKNTGYFFGSATLLYFDVMLYEIYRANLLPNPKLSSLSYISLIFYIFVSTFILIKFYKDFKIPE